MILENKVSGTQFSFEASEDSRREYAVKSALKGLFSWSYEVSRNKKRQYYVRMVTLTVGDDFVYAPRCLNAFMNNLRAYFRKIGVIWGYVSVVKVQEKRSQESGREYPHWHIAITCPYKAFPDYALLRSWWEHGEYVNVTSPRALTEKNCHKLVKYCIGAYMGSSRERFFAEAGRVWSRTLFSIVFVLPLWAVVGLHQFASLQSISYQTLVDTYWIRRIGSRVHIGCYQMLSQMVGGVEVLVRKFVRIHSIRSPWRIVSDVPQVGRREEFLRTWPLPYVEVVPF